MTTSPLAIYGFGPLRVLLRGAPMPRVRTRSVEWLLALLALRQGRAVGRSWLAGTLWPESEESRALQNLRNDLVSLRKALGPEAGRIESPARDLLRLDLAGVEVDVIRFDAAIQAGDEPALRTAVDLYTGPLLEGCLEEWALAERETRADQCLMALEMLADRAQERGSHDEAVRYLRRAATMDPLRDSVERRLMAHLAAMGDPAAAVQTYRDFRIRLREELLAEPDEATTRLFHEIRAAARAPARNPPSAPEPTPPRLSPIPRPLTPLIGRDREVQELRDRLKAERLVTLIGGGGVGKTRLALELAALADDEFPGGALWVELAPLSDGALILPTLAAALGLREEPAGETLESWLMARWAHNPPLLVLDNCEHLLDSVALLVQRLLHGCPELRALATSRQRLGLSGEIAWRVPSLPVPECEAANRAVPMEQALAYPAVQLFVQRAAQARPGFHLASSDAAMAVCQICRRLDGIPLALELAAARADVLTPPQILSRLDDRFHLLTSGARTAMPRHQTLRALIDWSYDLLSDDERSLLRRLSVFSGGWALEATEAMGGATSERLDAHCVLNLLASLVDKSLVLAEEQDEGLRYRMLETVRDYAREKLREQGEESAVRSCHAGFFQRLVGEGPESMASETLLWLGRLEIEHDNLRAALDWCLGRSSGETAARCPEPSPEDLIVGLRLAAGLLQFWFVRGSIAEGRQRLAIALARMAEPGCGIPLAETQPDLWARALKTAGGLAIGQSDFGAARSYYQQSLAVEERRADLPGVLTILLRLGEMAELEGSLGEAHSFLERSLNLARELGDRHSQAESLHGLGVVAEFGGDYALAVSFFEQSVPIALEVGAKGWAAWGLHARGFAAWQQGDPSAGRALLLEGLALFQAMGHRYGTARSLERLAGLALARGEAARAARLAAAAASLRETIGSPLGPQGQAEHDRNLAAIRAALDERTFARLWTEGCALSLEQAVQEAQSQ